MLRRWVAFERKPLVPFVPISGKSRIFPPFAVPPKAKARCGLCPRSCDRLHIASTLHMELPCLGAEPEHDVQTAEEPSWAKLLGIAQRKQAKCPRVPVFSVLSQQRFLDVPGVLQERRNLTSCAMYGLQQQRAAVVPQTKGLVARGVVTRLYLGEKRNLPTRSKRLRPEVEAIFRLRCGICASKCQGSLISSGLLTRTCYDSSESVAAY